MNLRFDRHELSRSAVLSADGLYRYSLTRTLVAGCPCTVNFVMLNPSTADAHADDPTIRRCVGFASSWGFCKLVVTNLFAFRATDPQALGRVDDPIGPDNDVWIHRVAADANLIIAAWGANAEKVDAHRASAVAKKLRERGDIVNVLGVTKAGHPRHPLFVRADAHPEIYRLNP